MKFYALSQSAGPGCPIGLIEASLYDRLYEDLTTAHIGLLPWYTRRQGDKNPVFQDGMVLITDEAPYNFDIRRISRGLYLASDRFLFLCAKLNINLVDQKKITLTTTSGIPIPNSGFNTIIINEYPISIAASEDSTFVCKDGKPRRFKSLHIKDSFNENLFKITGMLGSSDTLICSDQFRLAAGGNLKGVDFIDLESIEWPRVKII